MSRPGRTLHHIGGAASLGLLLLATWTSGCGNSGPPAPGPASGTDAPPGSVAPGSGDGPANDAGSGEGFADAEGGSDARTLDSAGGIGTPEGGDASTGVAGCGLSNAAFCETFDSPAGIGNRSGQLNGTLWGASRSTGNQNFSSPADGWAPTSVDLCGTPPATPENDIAICNGHLVESSDDDGTVTTLAMYPKQPFDFAGRTGKVVFDVSNDSQGSHAAWPEFWMSDKPVPTPFTHEAMGTGNASLPHDGFGIRFAGVCAPGQGGNCGPNCSSSNTVPVFSVDSAVVVSNYIDNDSFSGGSLQVVPDGCVTESTSPDQLNHIEVEVSQNQIDILATDAGTTSPLKHLATIMNANLTLTRGLIWMEDVHYNGNKFNTQRTHTFVWDNVGFDGPVLPRDLAYDALDNLTPAGSGPGGDPTVNLGWFVAPGSPVTVNVNGLTPTAITNAAGVLLTYNFWAESSPPTLYYAVNGNAHSVAWPFPNMGQSEHTLAVSVPLSDVQAGTNNVTFSADPTGPMNVFNVDLIMLGAAGIVEP